MFPEPLIRHLLHESLDLDLEYQKALESRDQTKMESLVRKAARSAGYRVGPVYHGGASGFNEFSYGSIGTNSTAEGHGFYFTTSQEVARMFVPPGGRVVKAYLSISKPVSGLKKTITRVVLEKVIDEIDIDGQGLLSHYGDVRDEGRRSLVWKAASNLLTTCKDDSEILSSIIHSGVPVEVLHEALEKVTGRKGLAIRSLNWNGYDHTVYLATAPSQIKLADAITYDDHGRVIPLSSRFDRFSRDIRF